MYQLYQDKGSAIKPAGNDAASSINISEFIISFFHAEKVDEIKR